VDNPKKHYWNIRLGKLKETLEGNNFEAHVVENPAELVRTVTEDILPRLSPSSVSWGGSMSFTGTGLYAALKDRSDLTVLDTYDKSLSPAESYERRRQALLTDLFFTGSNAVTESGHLVNLDMIGNRVGALTFGPKNVVVIVGRNKLVLGLEEAMQRIKDYVAPVNTMRLGKKTPCAKTGDCHDCKSPDRICNTWTITEKSFPRGRVIVILVNEDLGF